MTFGPNGLGLFLIDKSVLRPTANRLSLLYYYGVRFKLFFYRDGDNIIFFIQLIWTQTRLTMIDNLRGMAVRAWIEKRDFLRI